MENPEPARVRACARADAVPCADGAQTTQINQHIPNAANTNRPHSADKPDAGLLQSQIDQLLQMQLALRDTLQTQISLLNTHLYLVNAAALDRYAQPPVQPPVQAPVQAPVPVQVQALPFAAHSSDVTALRPFVSAPGLPAPASAAFAAFNAPPRAASDAAFQASADALIAAAAAARDTRRDSTASSASTASQNSQSSQDSVASGPVLPASPPPPPAADSPVVAIAIQGSPTPPAAAAAQAAVYSGKPRPAVKRISTERTARFPTPVSLSQTPPPSPEHLEGEQLPGEQLPGEQLPGEQLPAEHKCPHCARSYTLQRSLIQHLKIHMDKCPYQCTDCGRRFSRKGHLDAHIRTHTHERPFACLMCAKSFNQKSGLARHMRSHNQSRLRRYRPVPLSR